MTSEAPRVERIRRFVWMLVSTAIAAALIAVSVLAAEGLGFDPWVGPLVVAFFAVDATVFSWGVDRFDLVLPKQFRET